jgi:hypothetical protein
MAKKKTAGRRRKATKLMTKAGTTAGATERSIMIHRDQEGPSDPALRIDGPGLLSLRNHRLYRQGRVYRQRLKVSTRSTNATLNHIEVYRLRNTWMLRKAYKMAMETYMEATKEERASFSPAQLRWLDFNVKVDAGAFTTTAHAQNVKFNQLTGVNTYTYELPLAEVSLLTDDDGNEKSFSLVGGGSTIQYNILEEYNKYADTPDPLDGAETGMAYGGLLSTSDAATSNRVQADGADAPYDMQNISLDIWEHVGTLHIDSGSGEQTLATPYVDCPLGVMMAVGSSPDLPDPNDFFFTLEFAPGDYKGVAADAI